MFFRHKKGPRTVKMTVRWAGRDVLLLYRLYRETSPSCEKDVGDGNIYSLCVTMVQERGSLITEEDVRDIARSMADADKIYRLVSRGLVTPETVSEIVGDIISTILLA